MPLFAVPSLFIHRVLNVPWVGNTSKKALEIHNKIGYKQDEANRRGNIGIIYEEKGNSKNTLEYLQKALNILDTFSFVYGRNIICTAIERITKNTHK